MNRRQFLFSTSAVAGLSGLDVLGAPRAASALGEPSPQAGAIVKPPRLKAGDTVGLVAPATATFQQIEQDIARESLDGLGLKVKIGPHLMDRHGYLAGDDRSRAADINQFFADKSVNAVIPIRGGWGAARLLPYLDFDVIRRNPKILMGYSDITALLNPIYAKTGLITFHGPLGSGRWDAYSLDWVKRVLFDGEAVTFTNPRTPNDKNVLTQIDNRTRPITPGKARGRLIGGNLTVLTAIMGSPYVPAFDNTILFVEDVHEDLYRIDRMLTTLKLAGALEKIRGFIFGGCSQCGPGEGYGSLTIEEIFTDHIAPLKVPAWQGAMIGHDQSQWTVPVGLEVEIDADLRTLTMTSAAVI
jgi:muramoyltetrapeptide carboxypeptidase